MSRIGKKPIPIPEGVTIIIKDNVISVKGKTATIDNEIHEGIEINHDKEKNILNISNTLTTKKSLALHGLTRALINNAVIGVSTGFEKKLEIVGIGYNAKMEDKKLVLQIGFCHPVEFEIPQGLNVNCPSQTMISISGADKQLVGQFASDVRAVRPPEPYKLKGIKYSDEIIQKKAGKSYVSGS